MLRPVSFESGNLVVVQWIYTTTYGREEGKQDIQGKLVKECKTTLKPVVLNRIQPQAVNKCNKRH